MYYLHYLILFLILTVGVYLIYLFRGLPDRQFFMAITTSLFYFLWGIIYHKLEGDLHPKIVIEYLFITLFALFLLRGAIYR